MKYLKVIVPLSSLLFASGCKTVKEDTADKKPLNILFIAVDDLRVQANHYGYENMITPNMDALAKDGLAFSRAYVSVPVCGASRASMLSGARPLRTRFVGYNTKKDEDLPDYPSLPKWFKQHGYTTISKGKVYHHIDDDLEAWSQTPTRPDVGIGWQSYISEEAKNIVEENYIKNGNKVVVGPPWEMIDVEDNAYDDGQIADTGIEYLGKLKDQDSAFFLALGFIKPHLPFNPPLKYWNMYNEEDIKIADNPYMPKNAPQEARHSWGELRNYHGIPQKGNVSEEVNRKLVHGYYASVSYVDAQIGRVLDELERLGLKENTIVVLWGDHGWHLGEHTLWAKHCNFNRTTNAPLIISAPGYASNKKTETLVEMIDVYPTLCDLANLPLPAHLDGKSLKPVLENPELSHKETVYSRYRIGESVITQDYIYTEYSKADDLPAKARMLYDLKNDPHENTNIVDDEEYAEIVKELSEKIVIGRKTNAL